MSGLLYQRLISTLSGLAWFGQRSSLEGRGWVPGAPTTVQLLLDNKFGSASNRGQPEGRSHFPGKGRTRMPTAVTKEEQIRADTARLHQMGYAQQLFRDMGGFSNFAISFTIISVLTGGLTLYSYGLNHGGPQQMGIGWLVVGVMVLVVAAAMAQLASALPTAGALYYQAAKLGNKHWGWITGWFNLAGQITISTGIIYGNAIFAAALLNSLFNYPADVTTTAGKIGVISIFAILLAVQATINHVGVRLAARAADISVWWHIGVIAVLSSPSASSTRCTRSATCSPSPITNQGLAHRSTP